MKLQIDTKQKTIKVEDRVKITELLETIKKLFPDNEWKKYTIETNTVINNWTSPIYIREYPYHYYPWWGSPTITCGTQYKVQDSSGAASYTLTSKTDSQSYIYNVQT